MLVAAAVGLLVVALGTTGFLLSRGGPAGGDAARPTAATTLTTAAPTASDAPGTHTVRQHESLTSIGLDFGVTVEELRYWNREAYPSVDSTPQLEVGWVLNVEGPALPLPTLGPEPGPGFVRLPLLTVDVWNSDERYFSISGESPAELSASIKANIPPMPNLIEGADPMAYAGPVVWEHVPTYGESPSTGACIVTAITSRVRYEATIPQWTSPSAVRPELLEWWTGVLEHIRWHEEQHIRILSDFVSQIPARTSGQPCNQIQAIVDQWNAELTAAQEAFDIQDGAWQPPAYYGP